MAQKHAFLTIKEAAAILRCSPWTVYKYCRNKRSNFPANRHGRGQYKIPRTSFLKWAGLTEGDL